MPSFETSQQGYLNLWNKMQIDQDRQVDVNQIADRIKTNQSRYEAIEQSTGVPWELIASLHYRESDCDFDTYLGNGQSLKHETTIVPIGRGPFSSFEEGAIDALKYDGLDKVKDWPIERELYQAEAFNGWGYINKNINSPYVWSFSNLYTSGKYISDGVFDRNTVDKQCGVAPILKMLDVPVRQASEPVVDTKVILFKLADALEAAAKVLRS